MAEPKILYGGQAVIEGVMMRGRNFVSCAVRRANGEIILKSEAIPKGVNPGVWSKTPFLRALPLLWDTLVLGTSMLTWAANVQAADLSQAEASQPQAESATDKPIPAIANTIENEAMVAAVAGGASGAAFGAGLMTEGELEGHMPTPVTPSKNGANHQAPTGSANTSSAESAEGLSKTALYTTMAISLGLGAAVFFALPVVIANFLGGLGMSAVWNNIIEGVIRLALFMGYLFAIGRIPEIQRVFMYHGAEHKTIAAFEGGAKLVPAEVQKFSKEHPRCGTGFLLTVVVVSILFFVLLGDLPLPVRLASRIILIPFIATVSYELIRFASQHRNIFIFDWLIVRPSLALQSLTTRQPTDDMIEVAVAAFQDVRNKEMAAA